MKPHLLKQFRPTVNRLWRRAISAVAFTVFLHVGACEAAPAEPPPSYVLGQNDVLEIKVFQEDDLACRLRISPKGTIIFPLIGVVNVGGVTPQEAAEIIREKLAKDYLVNPQVTVTVYDYGKRRFSVLGEVQKAGTYDMPERERITLLDAIAMAGGYTRIADPAKITLKRKKDGRETIVKLNAKAMARDDKVISFELQPGDVITVGESLF
ncbi:MAG TPA: polysaccharide biosynthesis/export family protein [Chthoniobacter sp.]|jgi:polysaccharide export outer membrane protein